MRSVTPVVHPLDIMVETLRGGRQGLYAHPFLPFHPQVSFPDVEKAEWLNKVKEERGNVFIFALCEEA